ncbi:hypothetical protein V8J88_13360 [Massilia sp. W12]|uniref:hypothetical protein n=1 Tax=Massilia sp. W12 TaxID=3126507 RepID=UPI0030D11C93
MLQSNVVRAKAAPLSNTNFARNTLLAAMLAAGLCSQQAQAADDKALEQIRNELKEMRAAYEARMAAMEQKLNQAQAQNAQLQQQLQDKSASAAPAASAAAAPTAKAKKAAGNMNEFNPALALNLSATMANQSQHPEEYKIQGVLPSGGEVGPAKRGFSLGESEITLFANVDPNFSGQLTFALGEEGHAEVEEAFIDTRSLGNGLKIRAGRMFSGVGYANSQHAHAWDFIDAPLAYRALFGGQYKREGVQLKWLAPTERYLEFGLELGNGGSFPGTPRDKNGFADSAVFVKLGDDFGPNASWRIGAAWMRDKTANLEFTDSDDTGAEVAQTYSGRSRTLVLDGVWKWAANGQSVKISGEYLRRWYDGQLSWSNDPATVVMSDYSSRHNGWYVQGVYKFAPQWQVGLRHEQLTGSQNNGLLTAGGLTAQQMPLLSDFKPRKTTLALDYLPSEFSRLRLQYGHEQASSGRTDKQIYLQYNMSLGAHQAHAY